MKWLLPVVQLLLAGAAVAGPGDALRSCYDSKNLPAAGKPATELFVAIDQTTPLDTSLKQLVADNVKPFLAPGNAFSVVTFSAYTQGRYTEVIASGTLDNLLQPGQRDDISKPMLSKFDQCTTRQAQQAAQLMGKALRSAFDNTSSDIAKSDVLASIKAISAMVQQSPTRNKVVLIVSDMLENSSVANFYAEQGRAVRKIDSIKEMRTIEENQMLADFGGARVYVIGAGLLAADGQKSKTYRDPKTMQALAGFWASYMQKSKAQLVEFGQPALLNRIH